jgi:hypothetical protein
VNTAIRVTLLEARQTRHAVVVAESPVAYTSGKAIVIYFEMNLLASRFTEPVGRLEDVVEDGEGEHSARHHGREDRHHRSDILMYMYLLLHVRIGSHVHVSGHPRLTEPVRRLEDVVEDGEGEDPARYHGREERHHLPGVLVAQPRRRELAVHRADEEVGPERRDHQKHLTEGMSTDGCRYSGT